MARLIVNPDTPQAWEAALKPRLNTLGRAADNDVCLADGSVSGHHCEIVLQPDGARIRDLGSTNGIFIHGALVQEARLQSGQRIRLGALELLFEELPEPTEAAAIPIPPPVPGHRHSAQAGAPTGVPAAVQFCRAHPRSLAQAWCAHCQRGYCELCLSSRVEEGVRRKFCRECGRECSPVELDKAAGVQPPKGFVAQVPGAFGYPFRGIGPFFLGGFGVGFPLLEWVGKYGGLGGRFVLVGVLMGLVLLIG